MVALVGRAPTGPAPRKGPMQILPSRARLFWLVTVVAGGAIVGRSVLDSVRLLVEAGSVEAPIAVVLFVLAGALAQGRRVALPNPRRPLGAYVRRPPPAEGEREMTSVASAVFVFAVLALPLPLAVVVAALGTGCQALRNRSRRWYQHLFNVAQYALAVGMAGSIWQLGGGVDEPWVAWLFLPPTLAAYFLLNTGAVATVVALVEELPVGHVWLRGRSVLFPTYALLMAAGVLFWYLWREGSLFPSGLVVVFGVAAIERAARHTVLLRQQTIDALTDLANLMDKRDYYTHQHSFRVGQYAERIAATLGLLPDEAWLIFLCGRLHDIGKCAVSNDVLLKPGPLDPDERLEMSRHAEIGGQMLAHFDQFAVGAAYVRGHHEWYDGSGYPDGLSRGRIPLGARIIAVADAFDAMTTDRPYRAALPKAEAIRRLLAGAGSQWDPRVVQKFVELIGYVPPPAQTAAETPPRRVLAPAEAR